MPSVVDTDLFFPAEFARRYEPEMARMLAAAADASEPIMGGAMARGHPGTWCNLATGIGLNGPVDEADIDRLVSFYVEAGIEPRVEICATVDPSLVRGLTDRGFVVRGWEHVFASSLRGRPLTPPHDAIDGLTIETVDTTDETAVREAVTLMVNQFYPEPGDEPLQEGIETTVRFTMREGVHFFVVRKDGAFVGSGGFECSGPFANIVGAAVVPALRGRGIQQHLIAHRCNAAARLGAEVAVVSSKPGISTERNALRMGFVLAYSRTIMAMPGEGLAPEHRGSS